MPLNIQRWEAYHVDSLIGDLNQRVEAITVGCQAVETLYQCLDYPDDYLSQQLVTIQVENIRTVLNMSAEATSAAAGADSEESTGDKKSILKTLIAKILKAIVAVISGTINALKAVAEWMTRTITSTERKLIKVVERANKAKLSDEPETLPQSKNTAIAKVRPLVEDGSITTILEDRVQTIDQLVSNLLGVDLDDIARAFNAGDSEGGYTAVRAYMESLTSGLKPFSLTKVSSLTNRLPPKRWSGVVTPVLTLSGDKAWVAHNKDYLSIDPKMLLDKVFIKFDIMEGSPGKPNPSYPIFSPTEVLQLCEGVRANDATLYTDLVKKMELFTEKYSQVLSDFDLVKQKREELTVIDSQERRHLLKLVLYSIRDTLRYQTDLIMPIMRQSLRDSATITHACQESLKVYEKTT